METLEDLKERKLASRLQGIRKDSERKKYLKPYDEVGILDQEVEDILNNASSGLLDTLSSKGDSIFDVSSLPKTTTMPDYIAKRKKLKTSVHKSHFLINVIWSLQRVKEYQTI